MKSRYKYELAEAAGVSKTTFLKWFNANIPRINEELHIHISPRAKIIPPAVVKWVCERYCIELED